MGYMFWPIVDYWAEDAFMPTHPVTVLHNQKQKMVPFMTGITSDEGAMISAPNWKYMKEEDNQVQEFWDVLAGKLMSSKGYDPTFEEKLFYRMVAKFYFGGVEGITRENKQAFTDVITDVYMAHPNYEAVKLHAQAPAPVYNFLMNYRGTLSLSTVFAAGDPEAMAEDFGVAHADDLLYTWKISMGNYSALTTENDSLFAEDWIGLISNFAKYGNPTPVTSGSGTVWPEAQNFRSAWRTRRNSGYSLRGWSSGTGSSSRRCLISTLSARRRMNSWWKLIALWLKAWMMTTMMMMMTTMMMMMMTTTMMTIILQRNITIVAPRNIREEGKVSMLILNPSVPGDRKMGTGEATARGGC